jgi:HEAT repeat protein
MKLLDKHIQEIQNGESLKIMVISAFAIFALIVTLFTIQFRDELFSSQIYTLLPHLYIIPVILVALWYPKRGLQVTVLIITAIIILTAFLYNAGITLNPVISLLNAGLDIMIFVAVALYAKDRNMVDEALRDFFERSGMMDSGFGDNEVKGKAKTKIVGDFDELTLALQSTDDDIREEAARALGELQDPRAVIPLISALEDPNHYVRREAAKSLGRLGDERAIPALINALKDDDRSGREGAAEGLADMKEKALGPLIKSLKDPDWHVRMGVLISLRIIGDKRVISDIIEALKDENRFVRREAVKSLGRIGDERMVVPLTEALKDEDRSVRMRAVGALAKLGGDVAIEPLIEALKDNDSGVRVRAVQALEESKDPRAIRAISTMVDVESS